MESRVYAYVCATAEDERAREIEAIRTRFPDATVLYDERDRGLFDTLFFRGIKEPGAIVCAESLLRIEKTARRYQYLLTYLFENDMQLCFVREPYLDTSVYQKARTYAAAESYSDRDMKAAASGEAQYVIRLIKAQYAAYCACHGGQARVPKKRGITKGTKLVTRKSQEAKPFIQKNSKTFGGTMTNQELMAHLGITETTLLKYKRELKTESI